MRRDRWWQLAQYFRRNGYVRVYDPSRRREDGSQHYKKGFEARFVARTPDELGRIRALLHACGYPIATPFAKAKQWVQPVYGREHVRKLVALGKRRAGGE